MTGQSQQFEKAVFTTVISRFLTRQRCIRELAEKLCTKGNGWSQRGLHNTLDFLSVDQHSRVKRNKLLEFLQCLAELSMQSTRLLHGNGSNDQNQLLDDFIETAFRLDQVGEIRALLAEIPCQFLDSSLHEEFVNQLKAVTRLREAVAILVRMAREFPLVRKMRFVSTSLPDEAFNRGDSTACIHTLGDVIRSEHQSKRAKEIICKIMGISEQAVSQTLTDQAQATLAEAKIHAEIQLIYYCELNASTIIRWPRILCSSKDTCWLCNEFILLHGKMYTPGSHGKFPHAWRLPLLANPLGSLTADFNARLKGHVSKGFRAIMQGDDQVHQPKDFKALATLLLRPSTSEGCSEALQTSSSNKEKARSCSTQ